MTGRGRNAGLFRFMLVCLIGAMVTITACNSGGNSGNDATSGKGTNNAQSTSNEGQTPDGEGKKDVTLTYWAELGASPSRTLQTYNDALFYQELEKRTGVHIAFEHPAVGSEKEQFNLLIASGKYPDVIEYNFLNYPGGPEKALADNVIIELNDIIEQYAPNLKKYLDEHPDMKKQVSTDSGKMYVFPSIGIGNHGVTGGLVVREDWLKELGINEPKTIDDWTNMLRAFKEKKAASAPFTASLRNLKLSQFNGAFGIGTDFYRDNGVVKYGPIEPGYKEYLTLLNAWYEEGLIDPDFSTQDNAALDAKVINGNSGAFFAYIGGGMGKYLPALQEKDSSSNLAGVQFPILNQGDEPRFINTSYEYRGQGSVGLTSANQKIEETAKWLDYLYTDEGHILKSFGVEGVTFKDVNGYPTYTDLIVNNPDGLSVGDAMNKYLRVATPSVGFVGDDRYSEQYYTYPQQKEAFATFSQYQENAYETRLPLISHTPEEANEIATIMAEVNTYQEEMLLKFIMGAESIEKFDEYVEQLKKMKIDRVVEMKQAAVERYENR
ncbi:ABC transporter substrate-binding protein [Paenibacillus chungangensis]|uniref:ABC transporter substrate-binding protein n=1 Tax=Paenibacillus chungangensis TaxID=696535 RepID=A0ABW3HWG4_9BACL